MRRRGSWLALALGVLVLGQSLGVAGAAGAQESIGTPPVTGTEYPGDPSSEAEYVAAEDQRLLEVRTVGSLSSWSDTPIKAPYRLATGAAYTLVLTSRSEPYTAEDLLGLAPQTFVRQPDGSYLLSENIVIDLGATLNLGAAGGLRLKLASDEKGFVSIVNYGGRLNVQGTTGAPAEISSFDRQSGKPDDVTDDGRAYIRSIGGQISIKHAEISSLGFWSGRTGGLSLTGTDRPTGGALDSLGRSLDLGERDPVAKSGGEGPEVEGNRGSALGEVLPSGELPVPMLDMESPEYSFVSAAISDTTVQDNAFGIFVSGANGLDIRESSFSDNLVGGIVLHRYVVNAVVEATDTLRNGQDGVVLSRATTGIVLSEVRANDNGRNGVTISGQPLADGPNATGMSVDSYGNNSLANSEASDNGRYGVEVLGGRNVAVLANDVDGNRMGVVVRAEAESVDVVGNRVDGSVSQGIAVRDGVTRAAVTGNIVTGGETSLYIRDSSATVESNTLTNALNHAVSLVGAVGATELQQNKLSGRGPSAIDAKRAPDVSRSTWTNDTSGWQDTTPFLVTLKRFLQPLTLMWLLLGALLVFTAVHGARARRHKGHPYADKLPVSDGVPARAVRREEALL